MNQNVTLIERLHGCKMCLILSYVIEEGSIPCHTFCDKGPQGFVSRPKGNEDSDVMSNSFCVDLSLKVGFKSLGIINMMQFLVYRVKIDARGLNAISHTQNGRMEGGAQTQKL